MYGLWVFFVNKKRGKIGSINAFALSLAGKVYSQKCSNVFRLCAYFYEACSCSDWLIRCNGSQTRDCIVETIGGSLCIKLHRLEVRALNLLQRGSLGDECLASVRWWTLVVCVSYCLVNHGIYEGYFYRTTTSIVFTIGSVYDLLYLGGRDIKAS